MPIQLKLMPTPVVGQSADRPDPNAPEVVVARVRALAREWDRNTGQLSGVYHKFARELMHALAYRR